MSYENSRGDAFETSIADGLTDVWTHGCYHRGQIASEMRRIGGELVNTDFITFARDSG